MKWPGIYEWKKTKNYRQIISFPLVSKPTETFVWFVMELIKQEMQQADIQRIAFKELRELDAREGIAKRRLTLAFSPGLVDWLVNTGFDERYGARPLQRAIDRYVVTPLAAWMLEHQQVTDCRLSLDWSGGLLVNIEQFPE